MCKSTGLKFLNFEIWNAHIFDRKTADNFEDYIYNKPIRLVKILDKKKIEGLDRQHIHQSSHPPLLVIKVNGRKTKGVFAMQN